MTGTGEGVVHLVQGPLGIHAHANEPVFVAVFHDVGCAPESTILLNAYRKDPVVGAACGLIGFIGQDIAHVRLVRIGRHQIDVIGAGLALGPFEIVARMKINVIAFLGKSSTGLTVKVDGDIVVKLAVIEQGTSCACVGVGGRDILDEPVQYRQWIGQTRIIHHRTTVFRRIQRIEKCGVACLTSLCVCGGDVPAHHLAGTERRRGNQGCMVRPFEPAGVGQGDCDLLLEINAIMQLSGGHRVIGRNDLDRDQQVFLVHGIFRKVTHVTDVRTETLDAFAVVCAGCGHGEISQLRFVFQADLGQQLGQNQQVRAVDAMIQSLNGQDVCACMQKVKRQDRYFHGRDSLGAGSKTGRAGVPCLSGGRRCIVPCDFTSIEVGDHAVAEAHAQGQCLNGQGVLHVKRYAYINRLIAVLHGRGIQADEPGIPIAHARFPGGPQAVIKSLNGPGACSLAGKSAGCLGFK